MAMLRFDVRHGGVGVVSALLHACALRRATPVLVALCVATSSVVALSGLELLPRAPRRSVIAPGIVAPHREAFKRTALLMLYANVRLLKEEFLLDDAAGARRSTRRLAYAACLGLAWCRFVPRRLDLANANTAFFVVPLFLAVSVDTARELFTRSGESPSQTAFLLKTQLGAMVIAFVFTLAFRKLVDVRIVYAWSALCVAGRFARLVFGSASALSFLAGQFPRLLSLLAAALLFFVATTRKHRVHSFTDSPVVHKDVASKAPCRANEERGATTPDDDDDDESSSETSSDKSQQDDVPRAPLRAPSCREKKKKKKNSPRLGAAIGTVRGMFRADDVLSDDEDDRLGSRMLSLSSSPVQLTAADNAAVDEIATREGGFFAKDDVRRWARQAYVVHKKKAPRAAQVCGNLVSFRRRNAWPLWLEAGPLEAALRSGMHWVLPGRDAKGRRVVVYRAAALEPRPPRPLAELQRMMCLLLERLAVDDATLTKGLVFVVDLKGASPATLRHFDLADVTRGIDLVKNAFPLRLKRVFVLHLPRLLAPAGLAVRAILPVKIKNRLHTCRGGALDCPRLLADLPASAIPADLGGADRAFRWDATVDRLLRAGPRDPADSWL